MWSSTVEKIIDTPFFDYIDPGFHRELADRYKQRTAGKHIPAYELTLIRKDGSKLYAEVNGTVINHKGKQADMLIVRDITERKQAEKNLQKKDEHYKAIIENIFKFIPEGVLVFTESMRLLKQNKAFGDIIRKYAPVLGYTKKELAQKIIKQLRSEILSGEKTEICISRKS